MKAHADLGNKRQTKLYCGKMQTNEDRTLLSLTRKLVNDDIKGQQEAIKHWLTAKTLEVGGAKG